MNLLIDELRSAAQRQANENTKRLLEGAAAELERQDAQITSLHRALELLSHDVMRVCEETLAAITRHLGPPPNP
jgi:archaellum component FlaC